MYEVVDFPCLTRSALPLCTLWRHGTWRGPGSLVCARPAFKREHSAMWNHGHVHTCTHICMCPSVYMHRRACTCMCACMCMRDWTCPQRISTESVMRGIVDAQSYASLHPQVCVVCISVYAYIRRHGYLHTCVHRIHAFPGL